MPGGVLPRDGALTRLAQTGDPLALGILALAALAAATGAALALRRRRFTSRR